MIIHDWQSSDMNRSAACLVATSRADNLEVHRLIELTEVFRRETQLEHDLALGGNHPTEEVKSATKPRITSTLQFTVNYRVNYFGYVFPQLQDLM